MDTLDPRDIESAVNDPFSKLVSIPDTEESYAIVHIFNSTPFVYSQAGLTGFHYEALKDSLKWAKMSKKTYVPLLLSCMNYFIKGLNDSKK